MKSDKFSEELRKVSLKSTPARMGVLQALEKSGFPLDVNALIIYLKEHKIKADRVTVFRILNTLTKKGLTRHIQFNEGKFRYELSSKRKHHHFICERCGFIEDVLECGVDKIEMNLLKNRGFLVRHHSLEFFGLCASCRE